MTIALGMLCGNGAIVAADERRCLADGSSVYENKILRFDGPSIAFAIADAPYNANAAQSLVRKIAFGLANTPIQGWQNIEPLISGAMTEWYVPFTEAPDTDLIIAVILKGFGVQLYFCEPPNTVLPKAEGYASAGVGAAVTDPLAATLFGPGAASRHPQIVLRQIAYLMYRAKKDNAFCGGRTDAVYLDSRAEALEWVNTNEMQEAERASFQLDFVLNMAATATLGGLSSGEMLKHNAQAVHNLIMQSQRIRGTTFHDIRGNYIGPQLQ